MRQCRTAFELSGISLMWVAETEGFEPSEPFTARLVSSEVLSTTQPRLRTQKIAFWP